MNQDLECIKDQLFHNNEPSKYLLAVRNETIAAKLAIGIDLSHAKLYCAWVYILMQIEPIMNYYFKCRAH